MRISTQSKLTALSRSTCCSRFSLASAACSSLSLFSSSASSSRNLQNTSLSFCTTSLSECSHSFPTDTTWSQAIAHSTPKTNLCKRCTPCDSCWYEQDNGCSFVYENQYKMQDQVLHTGMQIDSSCVSTAHEAQRLEKIMPHAYSVDPPVGLSQHAFDSSSIWHTQ